MKRAVLDARHDTREQVFDALARDLGFPPHWGRNLDALYDVLRRDIPGPVEIVWHASARAPELDAIRTVLRDIARERADVTLEIEDSG
jgi:ribonuclease inhibitor